MASWWPVLQQRLVVVLTDLVTDITIPQGLPRAPWKVHDGPPVSDTDNPRWVSVGYSSRDESGGNVDPEDETVTGMRAERGTVLCEAVSWSGDDVLASHRDVTFAVYDALDSLVRVDQRLTVLPASSTLSLSATSLAVRDGTGTTHRLVISCNYFARS